MKPTANSPEYQSAISVEQMRRSDRYTIEHFVSGRELMLRAAKGIYDAAEWQGKKIAVVCGSGNNGGDGYALAGLLADDGIKPVIFRLSDKFSDDGKYYYDIALRKGAADMLYNEKTDFKTFDIIVDCIFGTGFRGKPEGIAAAAIQKINDSGAFVISADINSGLNGDTGEAELSVRSCLTVSIGYFKKGMFLNRAPELIGDLVNADIGIVLV